METKQNDNKLFFYNALAKLQKFAGIVGLLIAIATPSFILIIISLGLLINGYRMRFKFKRKAGHILFKG